MHGKPYKTYRNCILLGGMIQISPPQRFQLIVPVFHWRVDLRCKSCPILIIPVAGSSSGQNSHRRRSHKSRFITEQCPVCVVKKWGSNTLRNRALGHVAGPREWLLTHQRLDDLHRRTTVRTNEGRSNSIIGCIGGISIRPSHRCNLQQFTCQRQILFARVVGDQPVVTNPVKTAGQHRGAV